MKIEIIKPKVKRYNGRYAFECLSLGFTYMNIFDDNKHWQLIIGLLLFNISIQGGE